MSFTLVTKCRACGGNELRSVFDLGIQPLANDWRKPDEQRQGYYPLEVLLCEKCTLSQLSAVVNPEILYRNYSYVTSSSETMRRHFDRLFRDLESELGVGMSMRPRTIVEIGSNDGACLKFAENLGYGVAGIEPAQNLYDLSMNQGILTIPQFFGTGPAAVLKDRIGHPSIILARHCFAHISDWQEFVKGLEVLASEKTVIALEIPYVHDTLAKVEFDQVYSEHLSFISLTALYYLLRGSPFNIHRVIRYGVHGGSLLVMLRHKMSGVQQHLSADEFLSEDQVTIYHWEKFAMLAKQKINKMRDMVRSLVADKKRVCGFGASAKCTVWVNACGFSRKDLLFVSDNSPLKPGTLVPGTDIPVIQQDEFLSEHPDYAVCFAWNFRNEILESQSKWRQRGGRFIFPTVDGIEII